MVKWHQTQLLGRRPVTLLVEADEVSAGRRSEVGWLRVGLKIGLEVWVGGERLSGVASREPRAVPTAYWAASSCIAGSCEAIVGKAGARGKTGVCGEWNPKSLPKVSWYGLYSANQRKGRRSEEREVEIH